MNGVTRDALRRGGREGLTLAELLVVITIIAIGMTLILPVAVNLTRTQRVGSGARSLQAMLHGARSMAVAMNSVYGLMVYREMERGTEAAQEHFGCLITDERDTAAIRQQKEPLPQGLLVAVYSPNTALLPLSTPLVIRFQPDGTVDPGLACPIRIDLANASDKNDTMMIVVRRGGLIEMRE
jgi:prepilin-type N-terminal cleavage/methylation domain-containing protein